MEHELKSMAAAGEVPPDLLIAYDDVRGLWGGTAISLRGDGAGERREQLRGALQARVAEARLTRAQLLGLVGLRAWEQQTLQAEPVADESRATLTIRARGETISVWERFNELAQDQRLTRIKDRMIRLTSPPGRRRPGRVSAHAMPAAPFLFALRSRRR